MDDPDPPLRPRSDALWLGLIGVLGLILAASFIRPAAAQTYTGTIEPCLSTHGDRDRYLGGLAATGWTEIPGDRRAAALEMLTDAYLPAILGTDLPVTELVARRAEARAFWDDFSRNRIVLAREGQVLLLSGIVTDTGDMVVECWVAGPAVPVTDDLLDLVGPMIAIPGLEMAQINLPAEGDRPLTEYLVSRLSLKSPALAATDGLRTTIRFARPPAP
jgi:hypothetical protein